MSEQAKTSNKAYYIRLSVTLFVLSFVVALLLGVVNGITADVIQASKDEAKAAAMSQVMADCSFTPVTASEEASAAAQAYESKLSSAYQATANNGSAAGYVVEVLPSGFGGEIDMIVGVSADGKVTGVNVISNSETAGVGTKVMSNKNNKKGVPVLDQFIGKSLADGELVVGKSVDAISGATVSSKAVTRGINAALAVCEKLG